MTPKVNPKVKTVLKVVRVRRTQKEKERKAKVNRASMSA